MNAFRSEKGRRKILSFYRRMLRDLSCEVEIREYETCRGLTAVLTTGPKEGAPLILLHGTASNSAAWGMDIGEYSRHFRVYAVDIPGEPGFSTPGRFSSAGKEFTLWLDDLMDRMGVESAFFCGQSLGAWAALRLAVDRPGRVRKVCAVSPSGIRPPRKSYFLRLIWLMLRGERGVRRLIRLMHNDTEILPEELEIFDLMRKHFIYRQDLPDLFTDRELRELSAPVLYLAGAKDIVLNTAGSEKRLAALVPELTRKIYPEGGHALTGLAGETVPFFQESPAL